jgi:hypothetical protein
MAERRLAKQGPQGSELDANYNESRHALLCARGTPISLSLLVTYKVFRIQETESRILETPWTLDILKLQMRVFS